MGDARGRVPALDGLRGVAVGLVVLAHADVTPEVGGPIGVTVFFVLSGYLICGLLLDELDATGTVSLWRFWVRRALRLSPPLLTVIAAVGVYMWALGLPVAWRYSVIAATYMENIWLSHLGDVRGPFLNTWSLAMEEQFYLVWPVAVVLLLTRRRLLILAGAVIVASLAYRQSALPEDVQRAYSAPLAACYTLAAGCALAVARHRFAAPRWGGAVGLAGILAVAAVPGAEPFTLQLVVVACTVLVLAAPPAVLARRPLTWVGDRSYSIYLWQTPIFALPPFTNMPGWAVAAVGIPVTVGLACLTRRWVEQPGRRLGRRLTARSAGVDEQVVPLLSPTGRSVPEADAVRGAER